ncbi:MAG: urease accessory protein UreF [Verrucomicrobia bacterium]|nr:urease accessory protein UreF [Verrucomicrobiota bacterium]
METSAAGTLAWLPALLQTADPLFPTGAYAHSFGLEELVRLGAVSGEKTLGDFLCQQVLPGMEKLELPYLRFGIELAPDLEALCALDCEIHAWKLASEARLASVQIGTRRLAALHKVHGLPVLGQMLEALREGRAHGHHLSVCALQAWLQKVPLEGALLAYGYQGLAGACTAALKLLRIGQDGCQRALTRALEKLPSAVAGSLRAERRSAGCFSPLLEIASMRHALARERLFIS